MSHPECRPLPRTPQDLHERVDRGVISIGSGELVDPDLVLPRKVDEFRDPRTAVVARASHQRKLVDHLEEFAPEVAALDVTPGHAAQAADPARREFVEAGGTAVLLLIVLEGFGAAVPVELGDLPETVKVDAPAPRTAAGTGVQFVLFVAHRVPMPPRPEARPASARSGPRPPAAV